MIRALLVLAGAVALVSGGASAAADKPLTKVKAGHLVALDMAPLFVAKASGCFAQQGLDVETFFFANPNDNNAALAGGAVDFSTNPFTFPFFAANSGVPIRVVAAAGGWGVMEIIGQGRLGFKAMDDLKGYVAAGKPKLKIGTVKGDTLELILTREFARLGITDKDVELVYFTDLLTMVDAFRAGQLDILSHIKPYSTDMVLNRKAVVLTTSAKTYSTTTPNTVVSVLEKTLKDRPQVVTSYLKGLICAADIINKQPEKAVEYLVRARNFRVAPKVLLAAMTSAPAPISFTPDVTAVQTVVDELTKLGYVKGAARSSDIFRLDTIKALEKQ